MSLKNVYVGGTRFEANANKYTFVRGITISNNKQKIKNQLEQLWKYAESIAQEEMTDNQPITFEQIDAEKAEQAIEQINETIRDKPVDKR